MAGLGGADGFRHKLEEIVLHHVRLGGAAGFAGNDEQGFCQVDLGLLAAHLRRIGDGFTGKQLEKAQSDYTLVVSELAVLKSKLAEEKTSKSRNKQPVFS